MSWHPEDPRSWGGWHPNAPRSGRHQPLWGWGHPGRPLFDNQLGHRLPTGGPPARGELSMLVALGLFLLSPLTLLAWAAGQGLLRVTGLRWWKLALASLAAIAGVVMLQGGPGPALAHHFSGYAGWLHQYGAEELHLPMPGAFLWPQLPLAIPTGLLAAALNLAGRRQAIDPAEVKRTQRQAARRMAAAVNRACQPLASTPGDSHTVLAAVQIAALYRELRKGREDAKDEPGAADFYYGEMELRRHNQEAPWTERLILWLYWLVAGYSLRGLRALAWLAVVVIGLAGLLQSIGFNGGDPPFRDALIYAAQSTVSITSNNRALIDHVSWAGESIRIVLRLVGPLVLGLALLSVRNRVKR
jgi:hypothetical protein